MSKHDICTFSWLGRDNLYLDEVNISTCKSLIIGCYGGNTASGAKKNEDAVWCIAGNDWQLAAILDAHNTAESATLIVDRLNHHLSQFRDIMNMSLELAIPSLQTCILELLNEPEFRLKLRAIQGETALLICAQKDGFLWWLSIGDCLVYVLHEELITLGQSALNQRHFYEWIGKVNTFELPLACYSSGIRELRQGQNIIVMVTDGLLECGSRQFEDTVHFYEHFTQSKHLSDAVQSALKSVHTEKGRDSATIIAWSVNNPRNVSYPTP